MDLSVIGTFSFTLSSLGVLLGPLLFPGTLNSPQKKNKHMVKSGALQTFFSNKAFQSISGETCIKRSDKK